MLTPQTQALSFVFGEKARRLDPAWQKGQAFFIEEEGVATPLYLGGVASGLQTGEVAVFRETPPHSTADLRDVVHLALFHWREEGKGEEKKTWVDVTPLVVSRIEGKSVFFGRDPARNTDSFLRLLS